MPGDGLVEYGILGTICFVLFSAIAWIVRWFTKPDGPLSRLVERQIVFIDETAQINRTNAETNKMYVEEQRKVGSDLRRLVELHEKGIHSPDVRPFRIIHKRYVRMIRKVLKAKAPDLLETIEHDLRDVEAVLMEVEADQEQ